MKNGCLKNSESKVEAIIENGSRPSERCLETMLSIYKVLADKTRLKILFCLLDGAHAVSEMCAKTGLGQSLISHQLRVLRENGLVSTSRVKNKVIYSLADEHINELVSVALNHANEIEVNNEKTV